MRISLIIPTYKRGNALADTLKFALAQKHPDYEILVIDQTPQYSGETREKLEQLLPQVRYIKLAEPNLPAARNVGLQNATGALVVFVDDDVVFGEDYLASFERHFRKPDVAAVMGYTQSPGAEPTDALLAGALNTYGAVKVGKLGDIFEVKWVCGGNTCVRRDAVLDAGGYDEYFTGTALCEDTDMAVRLRRNGWRLLFDTSIRMVHLAIPAGGCENRNDNIARQRLSEELRFYSYFLVKNAGFFGLRAMCLAFARKYKSHLKAALRDKRIGLVELQWLVAVNSLRGFIAAQRPQMDKLGHSSERTRIAPLTLNDRKM